MIHVLFVCLGNICRSPLAQGIFEKIVEQRNWQEFISIDSAGTSAFHQGSLPHHGSIKVASLHSIDLRTQRSRPVTLSDIQAFDYILAMDKQNYSSLLREFSFPKEKVFLALGFSKEGYLLKQGLADISLIEKKYEVPDPYGYGDDAFENVFSLLDNSLNHFANFLASKHSQL